MGLRDLLRRIDARLLPPLGRGVRWLQAGPGRRRVVASTALIGCAVLVVAAVWSTDERARPVDDHGGGPVVRVGVNDGASIPAYVDASARELAGLAERPAGAATPVWALVSLSAYLEPAPVAAAAGGAAPVRAYARVPLPRTRTDIARLDVAALPADLDAAMDRTAEDKQAEAAEFATLAAKLNGTSSKEKEERTTYETAQQAAAREADQYRKHCACVYALVVRAVPADLLALASRPGVRAVDPAPEIGDLSRAVFLPPFPEQYGTAGPVDTALSDPRPPVGVPPASTAPR